MKRFTVAVVVAVTALAVVVASLAGMFSGKAAYATPGVSFASTVVARGTLGADMLFGAPTQSVVTRQISVKVGKRTVRKTVKLNVDSIRKAIACDATSPCVTAFQQGTEQPGGTTGWHTHPGATFVAVAQGEGTLYNVTGSTCTATKITPGTGFVQMPTDVHEVRNEGSVPLVVYTLYVLPAGTPNTGIRVDQPQPTQCPDIH
jgi:mannose-6-phosphate isomerase-like protein (cupin superfamily)